MSQKQPSIITISRQMASGGGYLGHLLARKLGYRYVDRQILYQAAQELGADIRELSSHDERLSGFLENLMKSFVFGTPEAAYAPPAGRPVYDRDLFEKESSIIRSVASRYDSVIVGRGSYWVLRNRPNALHLFVHASMEFRIHRYQSFHSGNEKEVRELLEESDRNREKFLKAMTGTDRYDARNYHLSIDIERTGYDSAEKTVMALVRRQT